MNAITKFLVDLGEGAVVGAGFALLDLPDGLADGRAALYVAIGGAIFGAKTAARAALKAYLATKKRPDPA